MSKLENPKARPGVWIKTFGCQMNEYDSEKMLGLLSHDYDSVDDPEKADLAIVNTCSVREKAEHKLYSLLGRLREMKQNNPNMVIGVGGCVAQQEGETIVKRSPSVDFVVGTHNLSLIPSLVSRARQGLSAGVAIDYREEWEELPSELTPFDASSASPFRALVAIQRGCNKHCSFCVVPTTRGPQVSRDADEIVREITLKARLGAKEVLLLGQTVNSFGIDLNPRVPFEKLVERIAEIDGVERIRFTSPHPQEVKKEFIELYGRLEQLCPHIHLPLQSGSDRILKLMNRNYRRKRYLDIVDQLREVRPDIAITADIIVGFPTESDQDFEDTLEVIRRVRYNSSYSFKYSRRPGTKALEFAPEEEVAPEIAHERLQRLQNLQKDISIDVNKAWLNQSVEVLVEGPLKKIPSAIRGRIPQNTLVEIVSEEANLIKAGEIIKARIERTSAHGLRGQVI